MKRCALLGIIWCKSFLVALIATRLLRVAMNAKKAFEKNKMK